MSGAVSPLPQYAFISWCLVKKHRDNFTFYFYGTRRFITLFTRVRNWSLSLLSFILLLLLLLLLLLSLAPQLSLGLGLLLKIQLNFLEASQQFSLLQGKVVSPTPNPHPGGPGLCIYIPQRQGGYPF
jgi:hypothetical protein